MKYYRRWKEQPEKLKKEGEQVGWHSTTLKDIIDHVFTSCTIGAVKAALESGAILQSPLAYYIGVKN